jgi:hypothetical protein
MGAPKWPPQFTWGPRADTTGLIPVLGVAAPGDHPGPRALHAESEQRLPPARVWGLGHAVGLGQQVQHQPADIIVPRAVAGQDVSRRRAPQAAPEGPIVTGDAGEPPGTAADWPNQDAADQDLLQDLPGRWHVGVQGGRPAAPDAAQPLDLLLLVAEVALVPLQVGDPGFGLPALLLGGLQLGHQGVHVLAHGDRLGQLGLGGGQLRDLLK